MFIQMNDRANEDAMTLTILYRHRDRPDEAGMIMISSQAEVTARVNQLEKRGFVVDKITARSVTRTAAAADPSQAVLTAATPLRRSDPLSVLQHRR
jgi:hypothetical protein